MSEREQVWRERIEWQPWSGLTVAECCEEAGVSVASFYRWKKLLTEPQGASATTIDSKIGSSGIRSKEANVSVCADCPARFFGKFRSSAEHRIRPWQQHAARTAQRSGDSCGWRSGWSEAGRCDHRGRSDPQRSSRSDNARSVSA